MTVRISKSQTGKIQGGSGVQRHIDQQIHISYIKPGLQYAHTYYTVWFLMYV
jgi:hypothetical protein